MNSLRVMVQRLRRHWRRFALACAALVLLASFVVPHIKLMRPRFEHVVVLDITQSMNVADEVLDGQPITRLGWAQRALQAAITGLPCGSKLGWAVFTEQRAYLLFTPVEVCAHRAELRQSLASISSRMAWSGNSEIAKGLHSGVSIVKTLSSKPSLVFVTDGQEAPPLDPRQRPPFDDKAAELQGLIVGVGALSPSPIPKSDPAGRPLGFWGADEVQQNDARSHGRAGSVGGEKLSGDDAAAAPVALTANALGATPGSEHMSSLREAYLRLLAIENGLAFQRLTSSDGLLNAMRAPELARPVLTEVDMRPAMAGFALMLLLLTLAPELRPRRLSSP
jgi:mxaL protein